MLTKKCGIFIERTSETMEYSDLTGALSPVFFLSCDIIDVNRQILSCNAQSFKMGNCIKV